MVAQSAQQKEEETTPVSSSTPRNSRKRDRNVIHDDNDDDDNDELVTTDGSKKEITMSIADNEEEDDKEANEAEKKSTETSSEIVYSPELLSMYYSRLFPYHLLHSWLSYNPSSSSDNANNNKLFSHREFSFTLERGGEEIYMRYRSFANETDLEADIKKRRPAKIDIGAVFSHPPKDSKTIASSAFKPTQRELVFDVDLTDYDSVRKCGCSGAKICRVCWKFMNMAVKVMDVGLKEDFGFEHVAWFYSGRRGVHAWVCDSSARMLSDEGRSAVASYFEIPMMNDKNKASSNLPHPLHPMLSRSYNILEPMFIKHVLPKSGHGLLATEENWTQLLSSLPPSASSVRDWLLNKWNKPTHQSTPTEKWQQLKTRLSDFRHNESNKRGKKISTADSLRIEQWPIETVFQYSYPRLDINVSKMRNHLLKSPFCVHPKTGRVCVPMDVRRVDEFDPFDVPTLPLLMQELDEYDGGEGGEENGMEVDGEGKKKRKGIQHEWQKTSLRNSFEHFEKVFLGPMWKELRKERREEMEERAAYVGDF